MKRSTFKFHIFKSSHLIPNRVYPYYLLANLYLGTGDTIQAKEMARMVLTKEPKVESTAIREMRAKMEELISMQAIVNSK